MYHNATEDWFPSKDVDVPSVIKMVTMIIFSVVTIVGVVGNLLTVSAIVLNRKLKSIPNVYVCNLAIADFIVCGVIAPFSSYMTTVDPRSISKGVCVFIGALNAGLLGKTIFSLTAIAINRYILLVKGGELYTKVYTRRNVMITVVCLWLSPLVLVAPALLGFGQFGWNSMMGTCIFVSHDSMTYIYVQVVLHGLCVGPCVIITIYCYARIIVHFRRTQYRLKMSAHRKSIAGSNASDSPAATPSDEKKQSRAIEYVPSDDSKIDEGELSSGPSNNNPANRSHHSKLKRRNKASRRVVANLCTVFTVFLACWMPVVTVYTVDYFNMSPAAVSHVFYAIAVSNSCLNVFIYAGMNPAFRKSYKNILTLNFNKFGNSF